MQNARTNIHAAAYKYTCTHAHTHIQNARTNIHTQPTNTHARSSLQIYTRPTNIHLLQLTNTHVAYPSIIQSEVRVPPRLFHVAHTRQICLSSSLSQPLRSLPLRPSFCQNLFQPAKHTVIARPLCVCECVCVCVCVCVCGCVCG